MHRALRRVLGAALAMAGSLALSVPVLAGATAAASTPGPEADADCHAVSRIAGRCSFRVTVPGSDGSGTDRGTGHAGPSGTSRANDSSDANADDGPQQDDEGTPTCMKGDEPVPCTSDDGYWIQDSECYISPVPRDPQPEEGTAVWEHFEENFNRGPATGAVYQCFDIDGNQVGLVYRDTPPQPGPPPPSPGEVARQIVAEMDLKAIRIGMSPPEGQVSVVGTPVWLWAEDPGDTAFGPITASASVRGVSVTATARVDSVRWNLGDGTRLSCGKGTPYEPRFGAERSPDCGHVYTRESGVEPGKSYSITATTRFVVEWSGAGQTGTITMDPLVAETQLIVAEGQVLVS